ncbi:hypothetical protein GCM10008111_32280 [Alishewanella tabrizica]|uniref:Uncharacterized protein n=1 Tax=Alishewanella tabrizica TaxID=671278 RepID=A0ABQ2WX00_9ALTE|nr:hypothetical protein GCM10008111_32280 [Alishewanella tabrizica]
MFTKCTLSGAPLTKTEVSDNIAKIETLTTVVGFILPFNAKHMGDGRAAVGVPATEGSEWCALLAATNIYPRGTAAKQCRTTATLYKFKNVTSQVRNNEMTGVLKPLS